MGWKDRAVAVENKTAGSWKERAQQDLQYGRRAVAIGEPTEHDPLPSDEDPNAVTTPEAVLLGAGQGVGLGATDEASGAVTAGGHKLQQLFESIGLARRESPLADPLTGEAPPDESFGDAYRRGRNSARELNARADKQHPVAYGAGEVAGDALANTALAIGTGGASLTPAGQGAFGAVSGLGRSTAELTDPTARDLLHAGTDMAVSGGISAGSSAVANKIGGWLKARAAKGIAAAEKAAVDKATGAVDDSIASVRGAYGSEVQKGSRQLENLGRELPNVSPELQATAKELTDQGAVQAVRESVVGNTLDALPGQVGKIGAAKQALDSAVANREGEITKRAADLLEDPIKRQLVPRLQTWASRALPIAASTAVGSAIGGVPGMAAGSVLGVGMAAAMGRPGTALADAMRHPGVRKLAWQAVEHTIAAAPERLGQFAGAFARAKSPQAVDNMLSNDPEQAAAWQAKKLELMNDYLAAELPLEETNGNDE